MAKLIPSIKITALSPKSIFFDIGSVTFTTNTTVPTTPIVFFYSSEITLPKDSYIQSTTLAINISQITNTNPGASGYFYLHLKFIVDGTVFYAAYSIYSLKIPLASTISVSDDYRIVNNIDFNIPSGKTLKMAFLMSSDAGQIVFPANSTITIAYNLTAWQTS